MLSKIRVTGKIVVETGMHIGGSSAFAAIGTVDSPVIKDVRSNLPIIPGSSLKGKMRSLLAKEYNEVVSSSPDDDNVRITRLFGSAKQNNVKRSRILFSDMVMTNAEELRNAGLQSITEVKFENTINRATGVANPRQIERVIRGSVFDLDLIYDVENESELLEDFEVISEGLKLLEYDYIGGNGSRGYGKVKFESVKADVVVGNVSEELINKCNDYLSLV